MDLKHCIHYWAQQNSFLGWMLQNYKKIKGVESRFLRPWYYDLILFTSSVKLYRDTKINCIAGLRIQDLLSFDGVWSLSSGACCLFFPQPAPKPAFLQTLRLRPHWKDYSFVGWGHDPDDHWYYYVHFYGWQCYWGSVIEAPELGRIDKGGCVVFTVLIGAKGGILWLWLTQIQEHILQERACKFSPQRPPWQSHGQGYQGATCISALYLYISLWSQRGAGPSFSHLVVRLPFSSESVSKIVGVSHQILSNQGLCCTCMYMLPAPESNQMNQWVCRSEDTAAALCWGRPLLCSGWQWVSREVRIMGWMWVGEDTAALVQGEEYQRCIMGFWLSPGNHILRWTRLLTLG